jgi:hypothetical protein
MCMPIDDHARFSRVRSPAARRRQCPFQFGGSEVRTIFRGQSEMRTSEPKPH